MNISASKAFGKQSIIFDDLYDSNPIVSYMRQVIRDTVMKNIKPGSQILEVNAGTATDAIFFARNGFRISAYDISPGMVAKSQEKINALGLNDRVSFEELSYENIDQVEQQFDYVYSNFGGLNCTSELPMVVNKLCDRLKPDGKATLVILPPFTLWEKLHYLRGNKKIAQRRKTLEPSNAHIEGINFKCWYYTPQEVSNALQGKIKDSDIQGLCIFTPPSFMEKFPKMLPRVFHLLTKIDGIIKRWPLFRRIGDYYIYTFTKV